MSTIFDTAVSRVRSHIPNFAVRYKDECWSSKVIGALAWVFNRKYMTNYTTTRYPRVYFPSRKFVEDNPKNAVKILAHEFVHLWDRKQRGLWFSLSYVLPQVLALFLLLIPVVGAFFWPWWTTLLSALPAAVCLLPLPAYWRMKWELRGYAMTMAMNLWRYGSVQEWTITWIVKEFTGWPYYKMWPFKVDMTKRVRKAVEDVSNARLGEPFHVMKAFVEAHKEEL